MFCTTLRRRPSINACVAALTARPGLGLRESRLDTHDIAISLDDGAGPMDGGALRCLRLLLLGPSSTDASKLEATLDRIQHFMSLTGGRDLAIAFLLQGPPPSSFTSARQLVDVMGIGKGNATSGMHAYTLLQATLVERLDPSHIPLLPVATLESLPILLQKYVASLSQREPLRGMRKPPTALDLLQLCTANPPMPQETAYILSDLFANLRELADACTSIPSAPTSSSPSARDQYGLGESSQDTNMLDMGTQATMLGLHGRLKRLRDLVGEPQCNDIVDFWRQEWLAE
ncbi:hypothetical protein LTR53_009568 [Teratosphaeriaceae sp. CCFEE 6253]|nr:hypothetical protein LTR53_009568 [Teratosphaeriaceae sp. CCFEE 6253]